MCVEAFAFLDQVVENGCEVGLHVGVCVFIQRQTGGGVFDEQMEQACPGKGGQVPHHFRGDEVEAASPGVEGEGCLVDHGDFLKGPHWNANVEHETVVGFAGVVVVIRFEGVAFAGFVATFAFQKGTD